MENTNKGEERRNKKGRNADESDYADYTESTFILSLPFGRRNLEGVAMAPPQSGIFNMSHFENLLVNQLVPNAPLITTKNSRLLLIIESPRCREALPLCNIRTFPALRDKKKIMNSSNKGCFRIGVAKPAYLK